MKKATMIFIGILYVASIIIISVFGMKTAIFNEVVPVTQVECINQSDGKTDVSIENGKKIIKIKFDDTGATETSVQLFWKVSPNEATNKTVEFIYNKNLTRVNFVKDNFGNDLGLIIFSGKAKVDITIMATDGTRASTDIVVWAY